MSPSPPTGLRPRFFGRTLYLREGVIVDVGREFETVAVRRTDDGRQMMQQHGATRVGRRQVNQDALLQPPQHCHIQLPANEGSVTTAT